MHKSIGPTPNNIMLIGSAPTLDDAKLGLPFSDSAGKVLADMLVAARIRHKFGESYVVGHGDTVRIDSSIYCTNIYKESLEKPEEEFKEKFFINARKHLPTPELVALLEELKAEIATVNPNVIIACGEWALNCLASQVGISNWQGSVIESTLVPGRKLIPICAPLKVRAEWSLRPPTIRFLVRAREQSTFPEIRRRPRHKILSPTLQQVEECAHDYLQQADLSFDIETKANHISCIGFAKSPEHGICIPLIASQGHYWEKSSDEARVWRIIAELLASPARKRAQNAPFDCSHLLLHGIRVNNLHLDTMLLQNILYPELEKSLATLTMLYTDIPYYKDKGKKVLGLKNEKAWQGSQADLDLWDYNVVDCLSTYEAGDRQLEDLVEFTSRQQRW